jgi:quercetin dioxygenase-like cupin family protein
MRIVKKAAKDIALEEAHGGSGARRLLIDKGQTASPNIEAMTHGYLDNGKVFDWHNHPGVEEIMYVLKGSGKVEDREGLYTYSVGDLFIFPPDTEHRIENTGTEQSEYVFFRIKV